MAYWAFGFGDMKDLVLHRLAESGLNITKSSNGVETYRVFEGEKQIGVLYARRDSRGLPDDTLLAVDESAVARLRGAESFHFASCKVYRSNLPSEEEAKEDLEDMFKAYEDSRKLKKEDF